MCDYSLHAIRNRLAVEGERLVVHRFRTGTIGLAPEAEVTAQAQAKAGFWRTVFGLEPKGARPVCAVCIPPGAMLVLHGIPARLRRQCGIDETEGVTFTQLSACENAYRDAVRFRTGHAVLLQHLEPGQLIEVLSLSSPEVVEAPVPEVVAV